MMGLMSSVMGSAPAHCSTTSQPPPPLWPISFPLVISAHRERSEGAAIPPPAPPPLAPTSSASASTTTTMEASSEGATGTQLSPRPPSSLLDDKLTTSLPLDLKRGADVVNGDTDGDEGP